VTDDAGKNATSSLNITVLPARVIGPSLNQGELLVGGIITSLIAISLVITVLSKRRKGLSSPTLSIEFSSFLNATE